MLDKIGIPRDITFSRMISSISTEVVMSKPLASSMSQVTAISLENRGLVNIFISGIFSTFRTNHRL